MSTKWRKKAIPPERLSSEKRSAFAYYNLTLSESFCLTDQEKQVQKFVAHWKFAKSRLKEKSSGRMRTKRQNRKECCFLRCFSSSSGRWKTSKLPQEGRVLSDRKIDVQTTLSSRSQLESSAGKPFTSSAANHTPRQELRTTPLQGVRMEGSATSAQRAKTTTFSTERRFFQSVNMIACHSAACTRKMATLG